MTNRERKRRRYGSVASYYKHSRATKRKVFLRGFWQYLYRASRENEK